jgi:signal transduction histidine kinase
VLPEDEERIFDMYTQGKLKDEKNFVQGTGIGLWVARQIMLDHGGNIHVWSELFQHPELNASTPDVISRGFKTVFSVEWIV